MKPTTHAFSLVETTIALGIASFAMVSILGLIPVGLQSVRSARDQAAAGGVLTKVVEGIRSALPSSAGEYTYKIDNATSSMKWTVGATTIDFEQAGVGQCGSIAAANRARFNVHIRLNAPATKTTTGTAEVFVAWPTAAVFDPDKKTWTKAEGSVSTAIQFLPNS